MINLKLAVAKRNIECMDIPTYIDGKQATAIDLFVLECRVKYGNVRVNAYANKLGIFYVTF